MRHGDYRVNVPGLTKISDAQKTNFMDNKKNTNKECGMKKILIVLSMILATSAYAAKKAETKASRKPASITDKKEIIAILGHLEMVRAVFDSHSLGNGGLPPLNALTIVRKFRDYSGGWSGQCHVFVQGHFGRNEMIIEADGAWTPGSSFCDE